MNKILNSNQIETSNISDSVIDKDSSSHLENSFDNIFNQENSNNNKPSKCSKNFEINEIIFEILQNINELDTNNFLNFAEILDFKI